MYYFAYIDADKICTSVYAMPSDLSNVPGYVAITEEQYTTQSVIGQRWNASTSTWEDVVELFYAVLDADSIVINLIQSEIEQTGDSYVAITKEQYEAQTILGYWYDRETQSFMAEIPFKAIAEHSTDEINYRNTNLKLSDLLDSMPLNSEIYTKEQADAKFALIGSTSGSGTGTPGAPGADGEDGGYYIPAISADGTLSWTGSKPDMLPVGSVNIKGADGAAGQDGAPGAEGAPGINGVTFTPSVSEDGTLSWTNDGGLENPAPVNIKGADADAASVDAYTRTETDNLLNSKADIGHGHDYAPTTHTHSTSDITGLTAALNGKAASNHTHTEYAASSHTHSNYASSTHTHSTYASSSHTHSNYFPTAGGTITGETNFSGGLVRLKGTQTLYNSGTMITLSSNNVETMIAGSKIYSKVTISVSSDERVKENIAPVDAQDCVDFINAIDVKTFNYKDNETPCVGVIAQQIEKLSPELAKRLVTKDGDGMLGVKTSDLVFPLIVAVQALSARVAELEK